MAKPASKSAKKTPATKPKPVSPALKAAREAAKAKGKTAAATPPKAGKPAKAAKAAAPLAPTLMDEGKAHAVRPLSGFEAAAGALSKVIRVPFKRLRENPANYRKTYDEAAIAELAESILAEGLLQNLVTFPADAKGNYVINSGNRRFRALQLLLKRKKIDEEYLVHIYPKNMTDAEALALAIVENLQRQDVDPMEEAEGFKRLRTLNWSTDQIAKAVGLKQRTVQDRLQLAEGLLAEARKALRDKKITLDHARAIVTAPTAELQRELVQLATRSWSPFNAEELRRHLRSHLPKVSDAAFDLALYKGEFVGEGKGQLFADKGEFVRLQKQHAKKLLKELKEKWKAASIVGYFHRADYKTENDPAKGEAFIVFSEYRPESIQILEGFVRKDGRQPDAETDDEEDGDCEPGSVRAAREASEFAKAQEAKEKEFASDLKGRLASSPTFILRHAIFRSLLGWEMSGADLVNIGSPWPVIDAVRSALGMPDLLPVPAKETREDSIEYGVDTTGVKDAAIASVVWERLAALPDNTILDLFASIVACDAENMVGEWSYGVEPTDRTVFGAIGLEFPEWLRSEEEGEGVDSSAADPMTCRSCGCTQDNACVTENGPCAWAEPGLCTACAEKEADDGDDHFGGSEVTEDEAAA